MKAQNDTILDFSLPTPWAGPFSVSVDSAEKIRSRTLNREWLEHLLVEHGAVLLKGLGVDSSAKFRECAEVLCGALLDYMYRSTPRTSVGDRIYTATEYRANASIPLHNENAYQRDWPMKLVFCCIRTADSGGETPLALMRNVTRRIDRDVVRLFEQKGVCYIRNYTRGVDLPWQTTFQTESKEDVDAYCRGQEIEYQWLSSEHLRTRQVCSATARHPVTGELLWFNQAHLFHVSSLPPHERAALLEVYGEENLPRNASFGDGSPIGDPILEHIRQAFAAEKFTRSWEQGDVLLLDNMLVAHARNPYVGKRQVLVAMADSFSSLQPRLCSC